MAKRIPVDEICEILSEHTDLPLGVAGAGVLEGPGVTFLIEYRSGSGTDAVGAAIRRLKESGRSADQVPLLVVPFMGEVGREMCRHAGLAWLDLSGNARITTPALRIAIEGRPNRFARRGRPSDPFAPMASRVARVLLLHPGEAMSQSELVREAGMDKGFVSRIVRRLEQSGLIVRDEHGRFRADDPRQLLAAWRASYDFSRHDIIRAVVAARSGPDALARASRGLREAGIPHAATGLAAAWAYEPFAAYRTATVYLERRPSADAMRGMGARDASGGANLWLVVPNDEGVFAGQRIANDIPCVSPLQTYLDLKSQPERAEEAAEALRRVHLPWATE